ncbi:MAG: DUF3307 domain-containing protein [Candidatus Parcubacteria bacterium]|nr:DUF3307 domain-containing protein [Candidatus Parcubacteria bacterium]
MDKYFAAVVLGHLAGDYLFQSKGMALLKSKPGRQGANWCLIHCLIYTAIVCLFLWTTNPLVVALVFLSHYPLDRWSLGSKWLKLIRGRDFLAAYVKKEPGWEIDLAFSCLVYAVVDNTMHLILLWLIVKTVL